MIRGKNKPTFIELLNSNLSENPVYSKLFESVGKVIDNQLGEKITQLARIRRSQHIRRSDFLEYDGKQREVVHVHRIYDADGNPTDTITLDLGFGDYVNITKRSLQDRQVLIEAAQNVGVNYFSDYMTDEDYARVLDYVNSYWDSSGTPDFVKFLGFIKNLDLDMIHLWTKDKGNDAADTTDVDLDAYDTLEDYRSSMNPVTNGGSWYQTSHVELQYNAFLSATIDPDLTMLFYLFAPIHLVLERLSGYIDKEVTYTLVTRGDIGMVDSAYLSLD